MKVLFAVSECVPFVKSGGLADVAGALPKELALLGIETAVMMPRYSLIAEDFRRICDKGSNTTTAKKPKNGSQNEELNMLNLLFLKFKDRMSDKLNNIMNYEDDFPDELLHDLKNILIKHLSSDFNQNLCYAVIFSVHSFQKDLAAHNRLRNRVLSPKLNQLNSSDIKQLQHSIINDHPHKHDNDNIHLTNRETEILKIIVKGYTNKEIAEMLNISLNTVLTHRKNIIRKTGVKTVSGLTFYCLRNGLLTM